jgi:spermidine/putrescine transport system substrate-binding protein
VSGGPYPREQAGGAGLTRRGFLARTAGAGLTAAGLGSLLTACGSGGSGQSQPSPSRMPGPHNPVLWPINANNPRISSGLQPEQDATLRIYSWPGHVNRACLDKFARAYKRYRCSVELSAFTSLGHAMAVLGSRADEVDVLIGAPTYLIGGLVGRRLIQPLNHGYLPNFKNLWRELQSPYYDVYCRYTVPYAVYTTGIAWRKDLVTSDPYALANGWDFLSVAGAPEGRTAILDSVRDSIGLGLLKTGNTDLSTTDPFLIDKAQHALIRLRKRVGLRIGNTVAADLASGRTWIHHAWSGQVAAAASQLPRSVSADVLGYWFPPDGAGPVANDTLTVPRKARNPVLAHLFIDFMLTDATALTNTARIGFMQPLRQLTPGRLVSEGVLPPTLISAGVLPTYVDHGLKLLEIPGPAQKLWQQAWNAVTTSHT